MQSFAASVLRISLLKSFMRLPRFKSKSLFTIRQNSGTMSARLLPPWVATSASSGGGRL
jgi:hypothetical protein